MNIQPNILSLFIEGAFFGGGHVDDDNLLQKGRPLIMRLRQQSVFGHRLARFLARIFLV
jgi:hypothetical protein